MHSVECRQFSMQARANVTDVSPWCPWHIYH